MKIILKKILNILIWTVSILLLILVVNVSIMKISGKTPNIFGYSVYTILTASMEPELEVGDVIISKVYHYGDELNVGDVITYDGQVGDLAGKLITHEVTSISDTGSSLIVVTKGIANSTADPAITDKEIKSIMISKVPALTFIYKYLSTTTGFILIFVVPMSILIIEEIINLIKAIKIKNND